MPWRKTVEMEERMKFVAEALSPGSNISELCRKYGISRTLGYKILKRYEQEGVEGIHPRSRRPHSCPHGISAEMVCEIVQEREAHPRWGGKTIRARLLGSFEPEVVPSVRTIERVLSRCGLVSKKRKRQRRQLPDGAIKKGSFPNEVWTVDFKGQWKMRNGKYVYPLTIRDDYSKYILEIKALSGMRYELVREWFVKCFECYGLPHYIRSDNGGPFASIHSIQGLSRLSAWWVKLGIMPDRILPRSPHLNGAHERMHLDMSKELEPFPEKALREEQKRFDEWRQEYNCIRPHQALQLKTPSVKYRKSRRAYNPKEPDFEYPPNMDIRKVGCRGHIYWHSQRKFISSALVKENIALRHERRNRLSVWYCELLLGKTDTRFTTPLKG